MSEPSGAHRGPRSRAASLVSGRKPDPCVPTTHTSSCVRMDRMAIWRPSRETSSSTHARWTREDVRGIACHDAVVGIMTR